MRSWVRFIRDTNGGLTDRVVLTGAVMAFVAMGSAHYLNTASKDPNSRLAALFRPGKPANVDYTPTASVHKQAGQTVLDPCTGKPK